MSTARAKNKKFGKLNEKNVGDKITHESNIKKNVFKNLNSTNQINKERHSIIL